MRSGRLIAKLVIIGVFLMCLFQTNIFADAITGQNITVSDGYHRSQNYGNVYYDGHGWQYENPRTWFGKNEDNEVENGCVAGQQWDLEGFYVDNNELSVVGGFDFENGYEYNGTQYEAGDIFIDINPDVDGYDYVVVMDYDKGKYSVYEINDQTKFIETTDIDHSNPFRVDLHGSEEIVGGGTLDFTTLTGDEIDQLGLEGDKYGNDVHNEVSGIDLAFLGDNDFTLHTTLSCGNDMLKGSGSISVPEPGTFSLLVMGSICMIGFCFFGRRKKSKV